jgi:hypothetical protein
MRDFSASLSPGQSSHEAAHKKTQRVKHLPHPLHNRYEAFTSR